MKRLCTICARGGSKGLKNKNCLPINGLPLLAHTIQQAIASELFHSIAVSSDSDELLKIAADCGDIELIKRPDNLATDTAAKIPAIRHATLEAEKRVKYNFDSVVDLDTTAPLRQVADIRECVRILEEERVSNVITATPSRKSPYFNLIELKDNVPVLSKILDESVVRRQDSPQCYDMNASIYVWQRNVLLNEDKLFLHDTKLHVMDEISAFDIDSELDYEIVKFLAKKLNP